MLHTTSSHLDSPLVHRGDSIRCPSQRTCLNVTIAGRGIIPPARANHSAFSAPPPATMQSLSNPWQARQLLGLGTWNLELGTFELARDASEPKTFYFLDFFSSDQPRREGNLTHLLYEYAHWKDQGSQSVGLGLFTRISCRSISCTSTAPWVLQSRPIPTSKQNKSAFSRERIKRGFASRTKRQALTQLNYGHLYIFQTLDLTCQS
jgi:hypothetical protein